MIIGFAGKKRSGKDTITEHIINKYTSYNFQRYAFGDPVKEVCRILFGFNEEQLFGDKKEDIDNEIGIKPREAFQKIGTEFGRNSIHKLFPDLKVREGELWIDIFKRYIRNNKGNYIISDVRFQNEADAIRELGGIIIYIDSNYSGEDGHESEKIEVKYDYKLENYGTLEQFYENFNKLFMNITVLHLLLL